MRIAYLFDRPLPATETDSEQVVKTVAALGRRGVEVTLVLPRHPRREPLRADAIRAHYQVTGDFAVEYVPSPLVRWQDPRKLDHARRALAGSRAAARADVVYTRNFPTLFGAALGSKPFAYETYRPWFDQLPPLRWPFRAAMARPRFVGAVLHSSFARDRYAALGVDPERLLVAHNGYDPHAFEPRLEPAEGRAALGLPGDRPLVVYTGHINATKGLDVVLSMARRTPEARFVLVGSEGDGVIERLARGHDNVMLVPWQRFDGVVRHLFAADVLLLPPSSVPLRLVGNTVLPMKLFLYLAAGRPILAPNGPDLRELLRDGDNAVLVPPGDARVASRALAGLLGDRERRQRLGAAALDTSRGLTWDARAEKIERFLELRLSEVGA